MHDEHVLSTSHSNTQENRNMAINFNKQHDFDLDSKMSSLVSYISSCSLFIMPHVWWCFVFAWSLVSLHRANWNDGVTLFRTKSNDFIGLQKRRAQFSEFYELNLTLLSSSSFFFSFPRLLWKALLIYLLSTAHCRAAPDGGLEAFWESPR